MPSKNLTSCSSVTFWPCGIHLTRFSVAPADVEGDKEMTTVVDLFPWTEYEFRVIATNTLGTGDPSSPSPKERTLEAGKSVSHFGPT